MQENNIWQDLIDNIYVRDAEYKKQVQKVSNLEKKGGQSDTVHA